MNQDRKSERLGFGAEDSSSEVVANPKLIAERNAAFREVETRRVIAQLAAEIKADQTISHTANLQAVATGNSNPISYIFDVKATAKSGQIENSVTWLKLLKTRTELKKAA